MGGFLVAQVKLNLSIRRIGKQQKKESRCDIFHKSLIFSVMKTVS
jgi:hypothetical protein